jgi:anion-transporting  ArsA/GET3 family ATPase
MPDAAPSRPLAPDPGRGPLPTIDGIRLHIVTGKGGTGKTTVASALAMALAYQGKRVLLAEVEGRQSIAQTFDIAPLGTKEVRILTDRSGGELHGLSVDAKSALLEYLHKFYRLARAGAVLERVGAVDFATTIAPGLQDVLLIGKVYEAAGRRVPQRVTQRVSHRAGRSGGPARLVYDTVVLDAPPTGRIVRFLNVNAEVADVARVGPVRQQADAITRMLRHGSTVVHIVTLLEEMPVQETVDTLGELRAASLHPGVVVVNQVHEPLLDEPVLTAAATPTARLAAGVARDLRAVGLAADEGLVSGLFAEAAEHSDRVALQREQEEVVTGLGLPVVRLPALAEGIEGGGIRVLADALRDQFQLRERSGARQRQGGIRGQQ